MGMIDQYALTLAQKKFKSSIFSFFTHIFIEVKVFI